MPRSAAKTSSRPAMRGILEVTPGPRKVRGASNITELFDLGGRFDRNEITKSEIDKLRNMIDERGAGPVAEELGLQPSTLLLVCAGFAHRMTPKTAARLREFLRG